MALTEQQRKEWERGAPYSSAFTQGVFRQLQQAQVRFEEMRDDRDNERTLRLATLENLKQAQENHFKAIERAEAAEALVEVQQENEAELVNACIWNLEQCSGGHCNDVTRVHDRLLKRRKELAGEEGCTCGGVLWPPCGPKCLALAEAPRAKHRSPQSGQKKADGD